MSDDELKNYFAGVGIALASTACNAMGLTCQKLAHRRLVALKEQQKDGDKRVRYVFQPLWLGGILFMFVGAMLSFAVFNFLGQSRASAMASITIVWNGILASGFLGERFTFWDLLVTVVIITGASIAVAWGSVGAGSQSTSDIYSVVNMLSRDVAWIGGIIIVVVWCSLYYSVRQIAKKGAERSKSQVRIECYIRIVLSGIMTGVTGMLASSVVKAIGGAVRDDDPTQVLEAYQFYLMLFSLPVSLVMQLGFLNSALAQMDALEIVPPYQAAVIIIGLLWGWVFTGDASGATSLSMGMFAFGCLISCSGVLLLGMKSKFAHTCMGRTCIKRRGAEVKEVPSQPALSTDDAIEGTDKASTDSQVVDDVKVEITVADSPEHPSEPPKTGDPTQKTSCTEGTKVQMPPRASIAGVFDGGSGRPPRLPPRGSVAGGTGASRPRKSTLLAEIFVMPKDEEVDNDEGNDEATEMRRRPSLRKPSRKSIITKPRAATMDNHDEVLSSDLQYLDTSFTLASSIGHMISERVLGNTQAENHEDPETSVDDATA